MEKKTDLKSSLSSFRKELSSVYGYVERLESFYTDEMTADDETFQLIQGLMIKSLDRLEAVVAKFDVALDKSRE